MTGRAGDGGPGSGGGRWYDDGTTSILEEITRPATRVIVIGAGMAGLTTANALAHAGIEAVVLEGRDRMGGRLHTVDLDGSMVDLGGSWIHTPIGNPMTAWADQVGVRHRPANVFDDVTGVDPAAGRLPSEDVARLLELAFEGFDATRERLVHELGPELPMADAIDRFASERVARGLSDADVGRLRRLLAALIEGDSSGLVRDLEAAHATAAGVSYAGDEFGDMVVGGYGRLVEAMARGLDVRLGCPVARVAVDGGGVEVATATGDVHRGSHVLVTVPLGVLKADAITFDPPLPADRRSAIARVGFGRIEKTVLRFERPFWRDAGVSSLLVLPTDAEAPVPFVAALDRVLDMPVLMAFEYGTGAPPAASVSTEEAVDRVLDLFTLATGHPAPEPTAVARTSWATDPFTRGGYGHVQRGSTPADLDELGKPLFGRLLFAGEATAHARVGYADGALSSGIREAKRLLGAPRVLLGPR